MLNNVLYTLFTMIKFSESVRKKDVQVFDVNTQIIEIEIDLTSNILMID